MSEPIETTIPRVDLLELARLVRQDGISSDILPAYLQVLLSVRLSEPDYLCRRAAARLSRHTPPLPPYDVAVALRALDDRVRAAEFEAPSEPPPANRPLSRTLKDLLARICRLVPPGSR